MLSNYVAVVVAVTAAIAVAVQAQPAGPDAESLRFHHRRHRGFRRHSPPSPTPPSPPAPRPSPLCNRTITTDGVAALSAPGGGSATTDCAAAPTPRVPAPPPRGFQPPCFCPRAPRSPFPAGTPVPPGNSAGSAATECVAPLAGLMSCGTFLTGAEEETPTRTSDCCSGLQLFLNASRAAAGDGDRTLRCLCPVIVGDVNKMLPKPVDPVRMMYLPIACGVVLPPQVLFMCFTGHQAPAVVQRFSQLWEDDASPAALSSP